MSAYKHEPLSLHHMVAAIFSRASNPNKDQKNDFKDAFQNPPRFLHLQQLRQLRIKFLAAYKKRHGIQTLMNEADNKT